MIHSVTSTDPRFRSVHLGPGLNIVLAERTEGSSDKDSRNGLGKTSLIEIIHFCLGAGFNKNHRLAHPELSRFTYSLDFDLGPHRFVVSRSPEEANLVQLKGPITQLPAETKLHKKSGTPTLSIPAWNDVLGRLLFGLGEEDSSQTFAPSFRSLIGYFIRRGAHAFSQPFEQHHMQQMWNIQVNSAFLLGLDWQIPSRTHQLNEIRQAQFGIRKAAELTLQTLHSEIDQEADRLSQLGKPEAFDRLQSEIAATAVKEFELKCTNVSELEMLSHYANLGEDDPVETERDIAALYQEVGVVLPDFVVHRFSDVKRFHEKITRNRADFVRAAMQRLEDGIAERNAQLEQLANLRHKLEAQIQEDPIFREISKLQGQHIKSKNLAEQAKSALETLRRLQMELDIQGQIKNLGLLLSEDFDRHGMELAKANLVFEQHTAHVLSAQGGLVIEPNARIGYTLDYRIDRKGSKAVGHMVVFCYDLMLARTWATRPQNPGFLIHDTTLFDGADEHQFTQALHLAHLTSEKEGFQYLCCLNSDRIPTSGFTADFNWHSAVKITLRDGSPDGGLFGFRFSDDGSAEI